MLFEYELFFFQDAKKDEAVRKAYKYLAALHEVRNSNNSLSQQGVWASFWHPNLQKPTPQYSISQQGVWASFGHPNLKKTPLSIVLAGRASGRHLDTQTFKNHPSV